MDKTNTISLTGHTERFRLDEDAYDRLAGYLDRAAGRLSDDPDRTEVLGDLERSVGDRLSALLGTDDRVVTAADIDGVLEAIGTVDTGQDVEPDREPEAPRKRRLMRIKEGQQLAGVCNGLAAYAELDVAWVRTGFVLGSLVTGGILVLVYVAMALILPVSARGEARR